MILLDAISLHRCPEFEIRELRLVSLKIVLEPQILTKSEREQHGVKDAGRKKGNQIF